MTSGLPFARHSVLPPAARPPVLHGLPVAGIIIAALSFIASLLVAACGAGVYLKSMAARERLLRNAPADLPVSSPAEPVLYTAPLRTPVGPRGLASNQRAAIVEAISQRIEMTAAQTRQLDTLMAESGADMFSLSRDQAVDSQAILQMMADHFGRLPSTAEGTEPFFFETPAGRAEVYENRALFFLHGRLSPVRVMAGRRMNNTGHPILLPPDVDALIRLAQSAGQQGTSRPNVFGDAQVQMLRSLLSDPQQHLVSLVPSPNGNAVGLNGASVRPDGYAMIDFSGGAVMLGPRGGVILRSDRDAVPAVSGAACGLVIFEGIASAALAVLLLIFCLSLLGHPRERLNRMVLWAVVKAALSLVGGAAVAWMTASYFGVLLMDRTPSAGHIATPLALGAAVALVGIPFPIIVLLVARNRAVRESFSPME